LTVGKHFWLREYNGNNFETPATSLEAGKGYIIAFPDDNEGETITFISGPLTGFTEDGLPTGDDRQLVANPTLHTMDLLNSDYHYLYVAGENKYFQVSALAEDVAKTLPPFEALITIPAATPPQLLPSYISVEAGGETGIGYRPSIDGNDPVLSVRHYTLQGVEVRRPIENAVYIAKKIHASGREEAVKVVY
jgi:hypothetical protein